MSEGSIGNPNNPNQIINPPFTIPKDSSVNTVLTPIDKNYWNHPYSEPSYKQFAKKLSSYKSISWWYGVLNGINDAYIPFKLVIDFISLPNGNATDLLHNFLMTPVGIIFLVLEALTFIVVSAVANGYEGSNKFLKLIPTYFPYFREAKHKTNRQHG